AGCWLAWSLADAPPTPDFGITFGWYDGSVFRRLLPSRVIALWLQVIGIGPLADANARLQAIFVCRAEVNAPVQPAHCGFLRCIEAGRKAAVHARQKI